MQFVSVVGETYISHGTLCVGGTFIYTKLTQFSVLVGIDIQSLKLYGFLEEPKCSNIKHIWKILSSHCLVFKYHSSLKETRAQSRNGQFQGWNRGNAR